MRTPTPPLNLFSQKVKLFQYDMSHLNPTATTLSGRPSPEELLDHGILFVDGLVEAL